MLEIYTVLKKRAAKNYPWEIAVIDCCWTILQEFLPNDLNLPHPIGLESTSTHPHIIPSQLVGFHFHSKQNFELWEQWLYGTRAIHTGFLLCFTPFAHLHTNPLLIESIYCKSRCSSSLRRKLFLLKLVLGMPSGKKVKQHPVCFLFGSYESSWRKVTWEACKKSPSHCTSSQMFIKIQWEQPWDSVLALLHGSPTAGLRPRTAKAAQPRTAQVTVQQNSHICERSASDEDDNKKQHPRASIPGSPGHWQHRVLCREARMWWSCLKNTPQAQLC